jgi:chemotaxis protein MotB
MRKKRQPEHVNHERWLISYADFITLLFAFFVVMFAVSQVDNKRVGRFTEAFSKALGVDVFPQPGTNLVSGGNGGLAGDVDRQEPPQPEIEKLRDAIEAAVAAGQGTGAQGVQVIRKGNELTLRLPDNIFFDSGEATVKDAALRTMRLLTPELRTRNVEVRVEGHTDDRPISTGRYPSNWELSTARATAVMLRLRAEGLEPARLSIAGYGEFRPIAPNATDDGRRQNRRVDIVVKLGAPVESRLGANP